MGSRAGLLTRGSLLRGLPGLSASGVSTGSATPHSGGTVPDSHRVPSPGSVIGAEPIIVRVPSVLRLWAPVLVWAGVIFALSSVSDLGTGLGAWDLALRKLAHATEFAVLAALLLRAVRRELPAFLLGVAYAVSDEVHQHFVPGRRGTPLDVLIDSLGVGLGILAWRRLARHRPT